MTRLILALLAALAVPVVAYWIGAYSDPNPRMGVSYRIAVGLLGLMFGGAVLGVMGAVFVGVMAILGGDGGGRP